MKKLSKSFKPLASVLLGAALVSCAADLLEYSNETYRNFHNNTPRNGERYVVSAQRMQIIAPYVSWNEGFFDCNEVNEPAAFRLNANHPEFADSDLTDNPWESQLVTLVGDNLNELKSRAVNQCEAEYGDGLPGTTYRCMVTLVNGADVCASEMVSLRARSRNQSLADIQQNNQQRQQQNTEALRETCRSFGFTDDTPEMANCLLELYKIENQPQQNTVIANPAPTTNNSQDLYQSLDLLNRGIELINGTGSQSAPINSTSRCRRMGDTSGQVYTFSRIGCPVGYAPAL